MFRNVELNNETRKFAYQKYSQGSKYIISGLNNQMLSKKSVRSEKSELNEKILNQSM